MPRMLLAALIALIPTLAFAHTGVGDTTGFVHGFSHPFGGLDHVLTMVAVGLFAARLGGRALWLVPLSFVAVMALGGALGATGAKLPLVEIGIGLSVIALGLAIAIELGVPTFAAMGFVACVALLHGQAHGTEMPETISGLAYGAGFISATALLHAAGIGLGTAIGFAGCAVASFRWAAGPWRLPAPRFSAESCRPPRSRSGRSKAAAAGSNPGRRARLWDQHRAYDAAGRSRGDGAS